MSGNIFPRWTNTVRDLSGLAVVGGAVYATVLVWFGFSPNTTDVGYKPSQPVPYSHALHVGQLGLDCRYCHTTVEVTGHAAIPPTATCMNCHTSLQNTSPKLAPLRDAHAKGEALAWRKVHDLPDYAYFNHSAHVNAGVGCVECHGRVDKMEVVEQVQPLSMGWCLQCHRDPAPRLRPADQVTNMNWTPGEDPAALGKRLMEQNNIHPRTDCSTCHR
ncbi:MAG: cytochrome c3 family protein [Planctomycetes bacterium]|nr:cytochrome c3 family protein [Planctomycetota bacterium]